MAALDSPVLVVGSTGNLGREIVRQLVRNRYAVRAMVRSQVGVDKLQESQVEIVHADLRNPASLADACDGTGVVIASAHSVMGRGESSPQRVDDEGHAALLAAARAAGVKHFVYVSACGARADHPVDFFRIKHATEQRVAAAGMDYTIVRGSAFMETLNDYTGTQAIEKNRGLIVGPGRKVTNYVAVRDVAHFIVLALGEAALRNRTIAVGGPENLTTPQILDLYENIAGVQIKRLSLPVPLVRFVGAAARPFNPAINRLLRLFALAAVEDAVVDMGPLLREFPHELTLLKTVIREWLEERRDRH